MINFSNKINNNYDFLEQAIHQGLTFSKNKVDDIEITIIKNIGINVNTRFKKILNIEFNNDLSFFVTVFLKNSKGSAMSTDLNIKSIKDTINYAINIAKYTSRDKYNKLPDKSFLAFKKKRLKIFYPWYFDVNYAVNLTKSTEDYALKYDKKIVNTEGANFSANNLVKFFANSSGMLNYYNNTNYFLSNSVIAKDSSGMQTDYYYSSSRNILDLESAKNVGIKSSKKAISKLSPRKIKTMKYPVIFSSDISYTLFSHLSQAIYGENVYSNSTFLINKLNKKIFPKWLSIYEKPHINKGLGSIPFDNEGVYTKNINIINKGVLSTWLLDNYSANKLNLFTTGHSGGISNWLVKSSKKISFKNLLYKMNEGLLITDLIGESVNIVNGDYSRGASGFFVKNGKIMFPVHEITISDNLINIFNNIFDMSNDFNTNKKIISGSILIKEINVSGY
ncbi:metalloprotease PmbA [Buchnera aphidicola (Taiwanaphis decaspermi)]|uniref:metalloprotease PmbA n=1 Tax=Buchnera aphidicola TaxID=9 RepID=UPI0031B83BB0